VAGEQPGVALRPRFPGCPLRRRKPWPSVEQSPRGNPGNVTCKAADIGHRIGAWMGPVGVVARSLAMITVAALAILVLLPAAIAAQATMPI